MSKNTSVTFEQASGPIDYGFTNDYIFRAILQNHPKVLTGLVSALLHRPPEEITSVEVTNPIELGVGYNAKDFILDIKVEINHCMIMNLEMQVVNRHDWSDRSLSYLCRSYDQLNRGQEYTDALPVIHIGFLDYTPFPDNVEFYSEYLMINRRTGKIYSDKFSLRVVDLTQIENATEEDKHYRIDYWARLFKAATWEEVQKMAKENEYIKEASEALFMLNADDMAREYSYAREDRMRYERTVNKMLEEQAAALAEIETVLEEKRNALAAKDNELAQMDNALAAKDNELAQMDSALAAKDNELAQLDSALAAKEQALAEQATEIARLKKVVAELQGRSGE